MKHPRALSSCVAALLALAGCASTTTSRSSYLAPAPALAARATGPSAAEAARVFDEGVAAYQRGELARAQVLFEQAYAAEPRAEVLFNLARVHDAQGHDAPAARLYLACGQNTSADVRRHSEAALARLPARVGWVMVRSRGAVSIDGEAVPDTLRTGPVPVAPGVRMVRVDGAAPVSVRLAPGEGLELDFSHPESGVLVAPAPPAAVSTALIAARAPWPER